MRNLNGTLRKVAILIASVDAPVADELLDQLPGEISAKVRRAIVELDEFDRAERQQVIEEFLAQSDSPFSNDSLNADEGVELAPELERKLSIPCPRKSLAEQTQSDLGSSTLEGMHFQFLRRTPTADIADLLQRQHPQVAAVVLAHLAPDLSANVLAHLATDIQLSILRRIADSQHTESEMLRELEHQLEEQLTPPANSSSRAPGLETVQAILAAAQGRGNENWLATLQKADGQLFSQFGMAPRNTTNITEVPPAPLPEVSGDTSPTSPSVPFIVPRRRGEQPTEWQFSDIMNLDHHELARLFQAVEPRTLLAALAGAKAGFVNRIAGQLPTKDADRLKQKLSQVKSWQPEEIQQAQQQLADMACMLSDKGILSPRRNVSVSRAA